MKSIRHMQYQFKSITLMLIILLSYSCESIGQVESKKEKKKKKEQITYDAGDVTTKGFLDSRGNMWFTTLKEGVFKFDGEKFTNYTINEGLCSNKVNDVIEDQNNVMWFATSKGLCKYLEGKFINFPLPQDSIPQVSPETGYPSRKTEEILSLIQDKKGTLWMGTISGGAYSFDGQHFTSYLKYRGRIQPKDSVYNNCIQSIVEDDDGNIWFTSQTHGGITKYDGVDLTNFNKSEGLSDDMIFSSFKDRQGDLWFGTLDNGLIHYQNNSFKNFKHQDWQMVSCFFQTKNGEILVGSFRGESILIFDGEKFTPISFDPEKKLIEIRFITEDQNGNIWFGGRYGTLFQYNRKELIDFTSRKRTNL